MLCRTKAHSLATSAYVTRFAASSVSIISNIAEGFGRDGNKEFIQFLSTAKGSASEVQAQLYVAMDAGFISDQQFQELYGLTQTTANLIGGFIRYLAKSDQKGVKFA